MKHAESCTVDQSEVLASSHRRGDPQMSLRVRLTPPAGSAVHLGAPAARQAPNHRPPPPPLSWQKPMRRRSRSLSLLRPPPPPLTSSPPALPGSPRCAMWQVQQRLPWLTRKGRHLRGGCACTGGTSVAGRRVQQTSGRCLMRHGCNAGGEYGLISAGTGEATRDAQRMTYRAR